MIEAFGVKNLRCLLELNDRRVSEGLAGDEKDLQEIVEIAEKIIAWGCAYPRLET